MVKKKKKIKSILVTRFIEWLAQDYMSQGLNKD